MAGNVVDLAIRITAQATDAAKGLDDAAGNVDGFAGKMSALAGPAAIAGTAIAAFGVSAFHAASDVQQALGATDTVFAGNASQVKEWAKGAADSVGLSESAYLGLANTIGAQLGNAGLAADAAAASTDNLISTGADLAATFGGSSAEAVAALSSALKGEADPAEKYGLNLSAAAVAAEMAAEGTSELTGEAASAAKAQAIMALATKQSGDAIGAFGREADTAEGATARAGAQWENTQATLGQVLLPIITAVSGALAVMATWMQENATVVQIVVGVLGVLAVGILAVNAALKIAAVTQAAFNAVMAANPIGLVVLAVVALIAGIVLLWNKCEWFRDAVTAVWEFIAAAAVAAWNVIQSAVDAVVSFIGSVITGAGDVVRGVWEAIRSAAETVWNGIRSTVSTVAGAVSGFISAIVGPIGAFWDSIKSAAETAWNAISSKVSEIASAISGFVQGAKDTIGGIWADIQSAGEAVWQPISDAAHTALDWIKGIVDDISSAVQGMIGWVQSAVEWVGDLFSSANSAGDAVDGIVVPAPIAASVAGFAASPSLTRGATTAAGGSSSSGTTIVIQGALDPSAVARQIRDILRRDVRRGGAVVMGGAVTL